MTADNIGCTRKDGTFKTAYKKRQDASAAIRYAKMKWGKKLKPYTCQTCGYIHLTGQSADVRRRFKQHAG